jgi:putative transposase
VGGDPGAAESDPDLRSCRSKRDEYLKREIRRVWEESRCAASASWRQLNREGISVARCSVARLVDELCLQGAVRGKRFKTTTTPGEYAALPLDLVERDFAVAARTACGCRTSRTWRLGAASCTWPS